VEVHPSSSTTSDGRLGNVVILPHTGWDGTMQRVTSHVTAAPVPRAWRPPTAHRPVSGEVVVPGSKSVTNRALLLAALAAGPSVLRAPLRSRDTELMATALRALGVEVTDRDDGWAITPQPLRGPADIDVGLAGTVMRFVPAAATLATGDVRVDGDPRARERPLAPLLGALRRVGAGIDDGGRGALPFTVSGRGALAGGTVDLDASGSSQLVSALLLTGARWDRGVRVVHVGERPVPNAPHLRMTVSMLRARGVQVDDSAPAMWAVEPGSVSAHDELVEPDLSSAAPFLAAAAVTGGTATVADWPVDSCQPGANLPDLLAHFGARSHRDGTSLTITGDGLRGVDLDLRDAGELTPVIAAVAALAATPSTLRGIDYLRGHETDRLVALARELSGLGAGVQVLDDGLRIEPRALSGALFRSYADHRLVMAAAVIGLVVPGVEVDDASAVTKTYPSFVEDWSAFVNEVGS
jgi:3-phosphoshikimate 1-carboxyvinyltransferase